MSMNVEDVKGINGRDDDKNVSNKYLSYEAQAAQKNKQAGQITGAGAKTANAKGPDKAKDTSLFKQTVSVNTNNSAQKTGNAKKGDDAHGASHAHSRQQESQLKTAELPITDFSAAGLAGASNEDLQRTLDTLNQMAKSGNISASQLAKVREQRNAIKTEQTNRTSSMGLSTEKNGQNTATVSAGAGDSIMNDTSVNNGGGGGAGGAGSGINSFGKISKGSALKIALTAGAAGKKEITNQKRSTQTQKQNSAQMRAEGQKTDALTSKTNSENAAYSSNVNRLEGEHAKNSKKLGKTNKQAKAAMRKAQKDVKKAEKEASKAQSKAMKEIRKEAQQSAQKPAGAAAGAGTKAGVKTASKSAGASSGTGKAKKTLKSASAKVKARSSKATKSSKKASKLMQRSAKLGIQGKNTASNLKSATNNHIAKGNSNAAQINASTIKAGTSQSIGDQGNDTANSGISAGQITSLIGSGVSAIGGVLMAIPVTHAAGEIVMAAGTATGVVGQGLSMSSKDNKNASQQNLTDVRNTNAKLANATASNNTGRSLAAGGRTKHSQLSARNAKNSKLTGDTKKKLGAKSSKLKAKTKKATKATKSSALNKMMKKSGVDKKKQVGMSANKQQVMASDKKTGINTPGAIKQPGEMKKPEDQ